MNNFSLIGFKVIVVIVYKIKDYIVFVCNDVGKRIRVSIYVFKSEDVSYVIVRIGEGFCDFIVQVDCFVIWCLMNYGYEVFRKVEVFIGQFYIGSDIVYCCSDVVGVSQVLNLVGIGRCIVKIKVIIVW